MHHPGRVMVMIVSTAEMILPPGGPAGIGCTVTYMGTVIYEHISISTTCIQSMRKFVDETLLILAMCLRKNWGEAFPTDIVSQVGDKQPLVLSRIAISLTDISAQ